MSKDPQHPPGGGEPPGESDFQQRQAGNGNGNFALVPKPPGALEKTEPGAKRILSGMVAETLALVKTQPPDQRVISVLVCGTPSMFCIESPHLASAILQVDARLRVEMEHCYYWSELIAAFDVPEARNFDIAFIYLNLESPPSAHEMPTDDWDEIDRRLQERIVVRNGERDMWLPHGGFEAIKLINYLRINPIPVVVFGIGNTYAGAEIHVKQAGARALLPAFSPVHPIPDPALVECIRKILGAGELAPNPSKTRTFRIVIVNDEQGPMQSMRVALRGFKGVTLSLFQDSQEAWQELLRADPDLLITDDRMAGIHGHELCQRLFDKKVTYPIIVSTPDTLAEQWVMEYASRGLNVTFLPLPFDIADFRSRVATALKIQFIIQVDDDRDLLDLYQEIIQASFKDVEVLSFTRGDAALQELSRTNPVLFITNLNMPKMDGIQVLSILAGMKVKFPVMMLTANSDTKTREFAYGIAGSCFSFTYFIKPGSGDEIRQFIQEVSKLIGAEPSVAFLASLKSKGNQ